MVAALHGRLTDVLGCRILLKGEDGKPTGYTVLFCLWPSCGKMNRYRTQHCKSSGGTAAAFFEPEARYILHGMPGRRRWRCNRFLGTLHFSRCYEDNGPGIVAHEALHAVLEYGRRAGLLRGVAAERLSEERLTYVLQSLVETIDRKLRPCRNKHRLKLAAGRVIHRLRR